VVTVCRHVLSNGEACVCVPYYQLCWLLRPKGNPTALLVSTCPPINSSHPQDKSSSDEFPSHNLRELVRKAFRNTQDLPYLRTPSKNDGLLQLCKLLTFSTNRFEIRIDSIVLALQQQVADVLKDEIANSPTTTMLNIFAEISGVDRTILVMVASI